jgi:hypothetical protein
LDILDIMTKEEAMVRSFALVAGCVVVLVVFAVGSLLAEQFGTAEEAKAMLERAVAAVKEDKAKALDMFNNGEGGLPPVLIGIRLYLLHPNTGSSWAGD